MTLLESTRLCEESLHFHSGLEIEGVIGWLRTGEKYERVGLPLLSNQGIKCIGLHLWKLLKFGIL